MVGSNGWIFERYLYLHSQRICRHLFHCQKDGADLDGWKISGDDVQHADQYLASPHRENPSRIWVDLCKPPDGIAVVCPDFATVRTLHGRCSGGLKESNGCLSNIGQTVRASRLAGQQVKMTPRGNDTIYPIALSRFPAWRRSRYISPALRSVGPLDPVSQSGGCADQVDIKKVISKPEKRVFRMTELAGSLDFSGQFSRCSELHQNGFADYKMQTRKAWECAGLHQ